MGAGSSKADIAALRSFDTATQEELQEIKTRLAAYGAKAGTSDKTAEELQGMKALITELERKIGATAGAPGPTGPQGPPGTFTAGGDVVFGNVQANANMHLNDGRLFHFAANVPVGNAAGQKEVNAGQIGYNIHGGTGERPHLAMVGGGRGGQSRKVKLWDDLHVTNQVGLGNDGADPKFILAPGSDAWLRLVNKAGAHGGLGFAADNLWVGGQTSFPNNGAGLRWGDNYSRIYDDGHLHVATDDNMYFDSAGQNVMMLNNANGLLVNRPLTAARGVQVGGDAWSLVQDTDKLCFKHKTAGNVMCLKPSATNTQEFYGSQPSGTGTVVAKQWRAEDFVVFTTPTSDIATMDGTVDSCKTACQNNSACVGFSRAKAVPDTTVGQCYLKKDITNNPKTYGNSTWQTFTYS